MSIDFLTPLKCRTSYISKLFKDNITEVYERRLFVHLLSVGLLTSLSFFKDNITGHIMSASFLNPLSQSIKMSVGHGIPLASVGLLTPLRHIFM